MDSKLKAVTLIVAALMVVTVAGAVLLTNKGTKQGGKNAGRALTDTDAPAGAADENDSKVIVDHELAEKYNLNPAYDPFAFLEDESFFIPDEEEVTEPKNSISLLVSSMQKDLRVFVVDANGSVAAGNEFEVTIRQKGGKDGQIRTLKDMDKDGILYTDGLEPGDYEVILAPMEGFMTPFEPMPVTIADQISYTVLSDISFLIHSEDEEGIDAKVEDTAVREAEIDADGTETNVLLSDGVSILGIDVSKWNKDIDWNKVKAQGVDFAILRCGYRGSKNGYLIEDPYFEQNIKGATEAGVRVGVYFFTQAKTAAEGVEEASMVLSLCKDYKLSFPLYIDTEGAGGGRADNLPVDQRTEAIKAFCETVENAGYAAGIYASKSWFIHNLDMEKLKGYSIWLAQYSRKATYDGVYDMWQYTSAGRLDGISTLVDLDLSYVDYQDATAGTAKRLDEGLEENEESDEAGAVDEPAAGGEGVEGNTDGNNNAGD